MIVSFFLPLKMALLTLVHEVFPANFKFLTHFCFHLIENSLLNFVKQFSFDFLHHLLIRTYLWNSCFHQLNLFSLSQSPHFTLFHLQLHSLNLSPHLILFLVDSLLHRMRSLFQLTHIEFPHLLWLLLNQLFFKLCEFLSNLGFDMPAQLNNRLGTSGTYSCILATISCSSLFINLNNRYAGLLKLIYNINSVFIVLKVDVVFHHLLAIFFEICPLNCFLLYSLHNLLAELVYLLVQAFPVSI